MGEGDRDSGLLKASCGCLFGATFRSGRFGVVSSFSSPNGEESSLLVELLEVGRRAFGTGFRRAAPRPTPDESSMT